MAEGPIRALVSLDTGIDEAAVIAALPNDPSIQVVGFVQRRFVRVMAWNRVWKRSGLSRYITPSSGASKPVRSFAVTMRKDKVCAWSRNRPLTLASSSRLRS